MHVWAALIRPYKLPKKNYDVWRGNCEGYMKEYGVRNQGKDILFCYMFIWDSKNKKHSIKISEFS